MLENFPSNLNKQGENFILDLKKFRKDNSERSKHFQPEQM